MAGAGLDAAACALDPQRESIKAARDHAATALQDWDMAELDDAVQLVVSELVTNALRHGLSLVSDGTFGCRATPMELNPDQRVQLQLLREGPRVLCVVVDPSPDAPVCKEPDYIAESGRGMHIIASCCRRWGWAPLATGGKAVWALFDAYG